MALSLGLESIQVKEEVYTSLEDLLQSELDFQNAYQSFIDYKNVCEIVVKAKASNESLVFASNLLNVSVENIDVSVEGLGDKLKTAWNKFLEMWGRFFNWFKNVIKKLKPKFPVTVCPPKDYLRLIAVNINHDNQNYTRPDYKQAADLSRYLKESEKLKDIEQVNEWKKYATMLIKELHERISYIKKYFNAMNARYEDEVIAARYYMMIGPKIIAKLRATLVELADIK